MPVSSDSLPIFYGLDETVIEVALHEPKLAGRVPEAFVQDLWKAQRFDKGALQTWTGEPITILAPGTLNTDGGPDFRGAHLRIGGESWHGDVEIHVTSAGWLEHRHHEDARYGSVVLHVALHADLHTGTLPRADGSVLPELVLQPYLRTPVRALLHQFYTRPADALPCADAAPRVPADFRDAWVRALAVERLRAKTQRLADRFLQTPDLDTLLYEHLFAGLGYSKNAEPMASLARRISLSLVHRLDDPQDVEALYLGTASLIPEPAELLDADRTTADYAMDLAERYGRLRHQFDVPRMERASWQFFRLRPANFPPLRIAQGVALLTRGRLLAHAPLPTLAAAVHSEQPAERLRQVLRVRAGAFWETHGRLDRACAPRTSAIGAQRANDLIVNAVAPVVLLYAEQQNDPSLEEHVLRLLRDLPPAKDEVTRRFRVLGVKPRDAFYAQGLHQLYATRCAEGRCLTCAIGRFLLDGDAAAP